MKKIIKRAGLSEWPKLMQNLRATRETELMALYPIKYVASWLGNSAPIAMKHYAMTMGDRWSAPRRRANSAVAICANGTGTQIVDGLGA